MYDYEGLCTPLHEILIQITVIGIITWIDHSLICFYSPILLQF